MSAGRPRKTVKELKLNGTMNKVSSRKDWNTSSTPFQANPTYAPKRYLQATKDEWNAFMKVKGVQGVLSNEDLAHVTAMFNALDDYYRMQAKVDSFYVSEDLDDKLADAEQRKQLKEMVQVMNLHFEMFNKIALRFGITPTERSRLAVKEKQELSPMLQLLNEDNA